ncbi:MAG: hypothetical protein DMG27_19885 [Acidobacteria bacterium]|nr:MAG: hypothetical protein DMG27_19885 [Acidobacteriota bacterium]
MWLLDVNMPSKLVLLLKELRIEAGTAQARGWGALSNSSLVEATVAAGFSCLLTRDRLFGESASRVLKRFPEFSVVLVTLPQLREQQFLKAFRTAWNRAPIIPLPGQLVVWPTAEGSRHES